MDHEIDQELKFKHDAMRKVDDMLTNIWLNALLCTNHYYPKRISDMETPEEFHKWNLFNERLK